METLAGEPRGGQPRLRQGRAERGLSPEGHQAISWAQGKGRCWAHSECRESPGSAAAEPSSASYVPEICVHSMGCWGRGHKHKLLESRREPHACEKGGGEHLPWALRGAGSQARVLLLQLLCHPFLCQPCLCLLASGQLAMDGLAHQRSLPSQDHGWRSG